MPYLIVRVISEQRENNTMGGSEPNTITKDLQANDDLVGEVRGIGTREVEAAEPEAVSVVG